MKKSIGIRKSLPFWQAKPWNALTRCEWDALCDRCACCCVHKTRDIGTGQVRYSNVACRYLDLATCRCMCYRMRRQRRPDCLDLYGRKAAELRWLPAHCAYRRLAEGKPLPTWHPLVTGDPASTRRAGMSVQDRVIPERSGRGKASLTSRSAP